MTPADPSYVISLPRVERNVLPLIGPDCKESSLLQFLRDSRSSINPDMLSRYRNTSVSGHAMRRITHSVRHIATSRAALPGSSGNKLIGQTQTAVMGSWFIDRNEVIAFPFIPKTSLGQNDFRVIYRSHAVATTQFGLMDLS